MYFLYSRGSAADVERAVASAKRAFQDGRWSEAAPSLRRRALQKFADLITQQSATLNALDAEEMGKPLSVTFASAAAATGLMRFCAEAVDKMTGEVMGSDAHLEFETLSRLPIDPRLIDESLLTPVEKRWLVDYHVRIRDEYEGCFDPETAEWLRNVVNAYVVLAR